MSGQKRTWQQVKIKYNNILQAGKWLVCGEHRWHVCWHFIVCADFSNKKKVIYIWTGGGPPTQYFTTAEELALDLNKGKPVIEGIQGGTATDSGPARDTGLFIQGTLLPYYCTWKILKSIYILLCGLCDFALPCSGWQHPYTFGATRLCFAGEYSLLNHRLCMSCQKYQYKYWIWQREATYTAVECTSADDETVSLDSRRLEVSCQFCGNRHIFLSS